MRWGFCFDGSGGFGFFWNDWIFLWKLIPEIPGLSLEQSFTAHCELPEQFNMDIAIINFKEFIKQSSLWKPAGQSCLRGAPLCWELPRRGMLWNLGEFPRLGAPLGEVESGATSAVTAPVGLSNWSIFVYSQFYLIHCFLCVFKGTLNLESSVTLPHVFSFFFFLCQLC